MKLKVVGSLDHSFPLLNGKLDANPLSDPGARRPLDLRGAAGAVSEIAPGRYRFLRDSLGINKLFWAESRDGTVLVASRPNRLVSAGCLFSDVQAIKPGILLEADLDRGTSEQEPVVPALFGESDSHNTDLETIAASIADALAEYCEALATAYHDRRIFVCLSGGLDSTGVAVELREHFSDVTAISFDLERPSAVASEDRRTAERLASNLNMPLMDVTVSEDELLEPLDTVLVEGVDWRDFNVHAALVNAAMARAIAAELDGTGDKAIVFTGDLMNEFLVDYHAESYRGNVYYRLPRLSAKALRRALVRGVETSHREVGIFEAWAVPVVQLYSVAAHLYCSLPHEFLEAERNKEHLSRQVFGKRIPEYVYSRRKTRAQIGDPETGKGVLALCIDRGIDQQWLRRRFASLHNVQNPAELDRFINAGRYRSASPPAGRNNG